jgi:hypothetical protein
MSQEEIGPDLDASKYTEEQMNIMKQTFPGVDTVTLARFLIARNGDTSKSIPMLQDHFAWKEKSWPALKCTFTKEFNTGKAYVKGTDLEGHPLIIFHTYLHDPLNRDVEELVRMAIFVFECAIAQLKDKKCKVTVLINRVNAGSGSDIEFARHLTTLLSNNYPERLYRTVVYPSSIVFYGIFQLVSVFLDPVTRNKVKPVMYLSGVQEFIANEHIPAMMGGESDYKFNPDDFEEPYPKDVIAAKIAKDGASPVGVPNAPLA